MNKETKPLIGLLPTILRASAAMRFISSVNKGILPRGFTKLSKRKMIKLLRIYEKENLKLKRIIHSDVLYLSAVSAELTERAFKFKTKKRSVKTNE